MGFMAVHAITVMMLSNISECISSQAGLIEKKHGKRMAVKERFKG